MKERDREGEHGGTERKKQRERERDRETETYRDRDRDRERGTYLIQTEPELFSSILVTVVTGPGAGYRSDWLDLLVFPQ